MKKNFTNWLAGLIIIGIGLFGRFWRLADFPAGLHQDEAWFGYNGWLLLQNAKNIYGEKWPLTVDMWGDHVSAIHSYLLVPFISVFGANAFAFRFGIVMAGIVGALLALKWLYLQTKSSLLVILTAALWAISPWSIVMSRASSSVIIDAMVLALLVLIATQVLWRAAENQLKQKFKIQEFLLGLGLVYVLTLVCYITYFTSRLLIPPFLSLIGIYVWWFHRTNWPKILTLGWILVIGSYLIFPFSYLLKTPYAQGRYQETAIIGSDTVKAALTSHIAQAGQAGMPTLVTRFRYNKLTENFSAVWQQYVGLISPSVLMFQNGPPKRYAVPNGVSVTSFEYLGVILALAFLVIGKNSFSPNSTFSLTTKPENLKPLIALIGSFLLISAIPSALTQDDFPNLQRAVIMLPWLQLLSGLGWFVTLKTLLTEFQLNQRYKTWLSSPIILVLAILIFSSSSLISFWYGYTIQAPFERPFNRSRAGEELAKWINANAHDNKILAEHIEGVFFYPYLFAQEDLRNQSITKPGKYFLNAKDFWIGRRHFVSDLCKSPQLTSETYDYYIFFTLHESCKKAQLHMTKVFEAKYDDGSTGFSVYKLPLENQTDFFRLATESATLKTIN